MHSNMESPSSCTDFEDLPGLSAKHLHLIKWTPDEAKTCEKIKVAETIAAKWTDIATLIGLNHSQIATIENRGSGRTPTQCLNDVFEKWREAETSEYSYTWEGLIDLLKDAEFGTLAGELHIALSSQSSTVRETIAPRASASLASHKKDRVTSNSIPLFSEKEQVALLQYCVHYIYELLDFEQVYPHLCEQDLLPDNKQKILSTCKLKREEKITKLIEVLPCQGDDATRRFVRCLRRSQADTDHRLADILEERVTPLKESSDHSNTGCSLAGPLMVLGIFASIVAGALFVYYPGLFNFFNVYQSKSLPYPSKIFVGREQEMLQLTSLLDFSQSEADFRIVNIVGSPGFGKSTLAIHVGDRLVKQGIVVHYVNMGEYQEQQVQQTLAEKVLKAADESSKTANFEALLKWLRSRFWYSVLILDDCDDILQNQKQSFFHSIKQMVEQSTLLKVLMTSREVATQIEYFHRYPVYELSTRAACELLTKKIPVSANLTSAEVEEIVKLTGNVPLAVQIIGALLTSPNPPSPALIIEELQQRPIQLLSNDEIPHSHKVNVSIYLSYRYLTSDMQRIGRYLANFPGSFHKDAAIVIHMAFDGVADEILLDDEQYADYIRLTDRKLLMATLDSLIHRSLIEFDARTQRYQFHRLIKEFFREMQLTIGDIGQNELRRFTRNFHSYYSRQLKLCTLTFLTDYKKALPTLRAERHNFQRLLDDLHMDVYSKKSFILVMKTILTSIDQGVLKSSFTDNELVLPLQSALKYFDKFVTRLTNRTKIVLGIEVSTLYVELVYRLSSIEGQLYGPERAMETCQLRKPTIDVFNSRASHDAAAVYLNYYTLLTNYQFALNNHDEAKACLVMLLSIKEKEFRSRCLVNDVFTCSFFEIGETAYDFQLYEQAANLLNYSYAYEQHVGLDRLFLLHQMILVYKRLDQLSETEKYFQELQETVQSDISTSKLVAHKSKLLHVITELKDFGRADIATALEGKLLKAIMDIGAHPSVLSTPRDTLEVAEYYYKEKDYIRTIQLAQFLLKSLVHLQKDVEGMQVQLQADVLIARARFWSGNYSQGIDEMEVVVDFILDQTETSPYTKEFGIACLYVIPRVRYVTTCYPDIFHLPVFAVKITLYILFVIPLEPYSSYVPVPNPLPTSSVPELERRSNSKEVIVSQNYPVDTFLVDVVVSSSSQFVKSVWLNILWFMIQVWNAVMFILQYTVIRFIVNVLSIFIRIYIALIIGLLCTFLQTITYFIPVRLLILLLLRGVFFLQSNYFIFRLSLTMLKWINTVDLAINIRRSYPFFFFLYLITGFNLYKWSSTRGGQHS